MSNAQTQAVEALKAAMASKPCRDIERQAEIKTAKVHDEQNYIDFLVEVGPVGDEGTVSELLFREGRCFRVGQDGEISLLFAYIGMNFKRFTDVSGFEKSLNH